MIEPLYSRTMTGSLRAIGWITQTVDLTPIVNTGKCTERWCSNALLIPMNRCGREDR